MRAVLFRTSDRPRYAERAFRHLVEHTAPGTMVCVLENSSSQVLSQQTLWALGWALEDAFQPGERDIRFWSHEGRLGGPGAINWGCTKLNDLWPGEVEHVFIVDDDVLVANEAHVDGVMWYWDDVLARMLSAGWVIAGHPWAKNFHAGELHEIGGVKGWKHQHVTGQCSGFALDTWLGRKVSEISLIRGYPEWQRKVSKDTAGYAAEPEMLSVHFDRPEHPWSLRDTAYNDWSDTMWYDRFKYDKLRKGKARPKGLAGAW